MSVHFIYFHGFASGCKSQKGALLKEVVHERVDSFINPDLNGSDFSRLTMDSWFAQARAAIQEIPVNDYIILSGSSLGAYTAAVLAAELQETERNGFIALYLLAPAFGFVNDLPAIVGGEKMMKQWREQGFLPFHHYQYDREEMLSYDFYESCQAYPIMPTAVNCPGAIVHGVRDEVVNIKHVDAFAQRHQQLDCFFVDDDHALLADATQDIVRRQALCLLDALS